MANRRPQARTFKGLRWTYLLPSGRYRAQIKANGERRHLGVFDTADAAHQHAWAVAGEVFGEFARAG